jgi:hypothetical protein
MNEWYLRPKYWILMVLGVVVLITGLWFFGLYLRRHRYSLERVAVKKSLQYQEGKTSQIMQLMQEYEKASEGQKAFILARIEIETERIGIDNVPQNVQRLIRSMK